MREGSKAVWIFSRKLIRFGGPSHPYGQVVRCVIFNIYIKEIVVRPGVEMCDFFKDILRKSL